MYGWMKRLVLTFDPRGALLGGRPFVATKREHVEHDWFASKIYHAKDLASHDFG
jgi:hypothetical protein